MSNSRSNKISLKFMLKALILWLSFACKSLAEPPPTEMSNIRFIRKDGQSVDGAVVCQRFFDAAVKSGVKPNYASAVWHDAMHGDPLARELIEELCEIEIVSSTAGVGF